MRASALGLAVVGLAALLATGCWAWLSQPHAPTYTNQELRATCERQGGWWRGELIDGYCEYQAPGFL